MAECRKERSWSWRAAEEEGGFCEEDEEQFCLTDQDTSLGQCPACSLAFCIYCNQTYHGVSPCKFKSAEQRAILDQYRAAEGGERQLLERRYGRWQLVTMANTLASEDYVTTHAQHCPRVQQDHLLEVREGGRSEAVAR